MRRSLTCSNTHGNSEEQIYDSTRRNHWWGIPFPHILSLFRQAEFCEEGVKPGLSSEQHELALDTSPQSKGKHVQDTASHSQASCRLGQHPGKRAKGHSLGRRGLLGHQQTRAPPAPRHPLWLSVPWRPWTGTELCRCRWANTRCGVAA